MNKQKLLRMLFALFVTLTVVFGILLLLQDTRVDVIGRIGLWCGFVSQLLLAIAMYTEIRRINKGKE